MLIMLIMEHELPAVTSLTVGTSIRSTRAKQLVLKDVVPISAGNLKSISHQRYCNETYTLTTVAVNS